MLKQQLKLIWRSIRSGHGLVNLSGLVLGFLFFILIQAWLVFQQGYDTFHRKANLIYRVVKHVPDARTGYTPIAVTPGPLASELALQTGIASTVRITPVEFCIRTGENCLYKKGIAADSTFWRMFDFKKLDSLGQSMQGPDQIILTERLAKVFFGNASALGKTCIIGPRTLVVTGIIANPPANNHLGNFDFFLPMEFMRVNGLRDTENWMQSNFYTYVELHRGNQALPVEKAVSNLLQKHDQRGVRLTLQPLPDVHLQSGHLSNDLPERGSEQYVRIFSWVATFVLLIACLTYINLSTAQYLKNIRQVGIRQFLGASLGQLAWQSVGQVLIYNLFALALASGLAWVALPSVELLTGSPLRQTLHLKDIAVPVITAFAMAIVISSLIPVALQTRQKVAEGLKGWVFQPRAVPLTRRLLVVLQFSLALGLITAMWIVKAQLGFIQNKDLGYKREAVVSFTAVRGLSERFDPFKAELLTLPNVQAVCRHQHPITAIQQTTDEVEWQGKPTGNNLLFHKLSVDVDFVDTYGLQVLSGRKFSEVSVADSNAILLNGKAAAAMGITRAEEQPIRVSGHPYRVVGIIRDFHLTSVHAPIEPLILLMQPSILSNVSVAVQPGKQQQSIKEIEEIFKKYAPGRPFDYHFIDEDLALLYAAEERMQIILSYLGAASVVLACLGLLAISLLQVQQRTREVAIRKVNGASLLAIARLLVREYIVLLAGAMALSSLLVLYFMSKWLQEFAYRVSLPPEAFFYSYGVVSTVALLAVGASLLKALRTNPAHALRHS